MLDSHWIRVVRIVVEVQCAAGAAHCSEEELVCRHVTNMKSTIGFGTIFTDISAMVNKPSEKESWYVVVVLGPRYGHCEAYESNRVQLISEQMGTPEYR